MLLSDVIGNKMVKIIHRKLVFSRNLKIAQLVPIHKKGAHDDMNNYRPISLLSNFSKILEKVIKFRLINFIQNTSKFDPNQYGFQKNSNTMEATTDLIEYVTSEVVC